MGKLIDTASADTMAELQSGTGLETFASLRT